MEDFSMYITDEILDIIECKLPELDDVGLYPFCNDVISESNSDFSNKRIFYTLGLFLMNMFDDNVKKLADALLISGFRKWEGLDDLNTVIGKVGYSKYADIGCIYKIMLGWWGGMPSSKEEGKFIQIDVDYIRNKSDYYFGVRLEDIKAIDKPFIDSFLMINNIDRKLWDYLYVAMEDSYGLSGKHNMYTDMYDSSQALRGEPRRCSYISLSQWDKLLVDDGSSLKLENCSVSTALPKNILDKYGLKIDEV